ncbi:MAG: 3-methyl-2-oxobutanoate hydroxymethyltransferase [Chloroflexi bacterium]|nr:3-methyl-2-oxobutanoate hydroxymethyltransferase [Chloroflexota bacterium]
MARRTVADLQQMKKDGKKIAAGVVYEAQMTRIFERAGVDLLSVGDSLGRTFLGYKTGSEHGIDEMLVFGRAVMRTAESAVVNIDMPTSVCEAGATAVLSAAKRIKEEAGADLTKVDLREHEEEMIDQVQAVIDSGLAAYPQIGFEFVQGGERHGSAADHDHIMKWAHAVEDAGASMLDLTMVSPEIYGDVAKGLRIPVIGGQAGPEADGKIYVSYALVGYQAQTIDRTDGSPSAAKFMYDIAQKAVDAVHAGTW